MIFSCFRSRKQRTSTDKRPLDNNNNSSSLPTTAGASKSAGVRTKNVVCVKLAPRTTILHTPKQAVGSRITLATARRRNPNLIIRMEQASQSVSRKSSIRTIEPKKPDVDIEAGLHNTSPSTSLEKQTVLSDVPRPTSPVTGLKPMLAQAQNDELRQALAKRAAKREAQEAALAKASTTDTNTVTKVDGQDK